MALKIPLKKTAPPPTMPPGVEDNGEAAMQTECDPESSTAALSVAVPQPTAVDPEVARWLQQAFAAERAPQARPAAAPARRSAAPAVRGSYMLMLALSLGTLLITLA